MRIVIIEDEAYATRRLENMVSQYNPDYKIVARLESVHESIDWFNNNPHPDLIFLDIHLEDDISFAIFRKISVSCPVIFTTATDDLALKAFQSKGIDFLHKPVVQSELYELLSKIPKEKSTKNQSIDPGFFESLFTRKF